MQIKGIFDQEGLSNCMEFVTKAKNVLFVKKLGKLKK